ncbi:MAG: NAD(P)-binding domain-containing protein, partial [Bacteroidia bacterium]|nr:NAD(P)-binding domain-containing protein [Bacteroidia bacterium]
MPKASKKNIAVLGCGNMAWHIVRQLNKKFKIQVSNHKPNNELLKFASDFNVQISGDFKNISETADVYFVCVKDEFIESAIKNLNKNAVVLITSGNFDLKNIPASYKNCAI